MGLSGRMLMLGVMVLGLALAGRTAWAEWAMVEVTSDDAVAGQTVRAHARVALRGAGFEVLSEESARAVAPSRQELERCVRRAPACMQDALLVAHVQRLLLFRVERTRRGLTVRVRVYEGATGRLVRTGRQRCAPCDTEALERAVAQVVAAALGPGAARSATGSSAESTTGSSGTSVAGDTAAPADLTLAAQPVPSLLAAPALAAQPVAGRSGAWKWMALGSGAGMVGLGVAGMILDGPRFGADGKRQPERWSTMAPGVAAAMAGAALLGVSGYLFYTDEGVGVSVTGTF